MEIPRTLVSEWYGYWTSVAERSLEQWRTISDEVARREYGPQQYMSDMIEFWNTTAVGWWAMVPDASQLVPTLFINLEGGDAGPATVTRTIPAHRLGIPMGPPRWAFLRPVVGGNPAEINEARCKVRWSESGNQLVVELFGPKAKETADAALELGVAGYTKPVPLTPGVYQGLVYVRSAPLAVLYIRVGQP
jgi:hypothetical protein